MRHRKSGRKLKRTASHRRATLAALATALLRHKRITTTVAKAKETRMLVEKIITRAKNAMPKQQADAGAVSARQQEFMKAGGHARREVGRLIKDRTVIGELFSTIAEKVASRPGGYTRIVKLGQRQGDGAEMAVIELVDFNTGHEPAQKPSPSTKEKKSKQTKKAEKEPKAPKAEKEKTAESGDEAVRKKGSSSHVAPRESR
jgi:large subunit ribosomal protein L17